MSGSVNPPKARPILFSAPMVRALLDGRKTQTRRTVKPQSLFDGMAEVIRQFPAQTGSPYGKPGDLLWVKETWRPQVAHSHGENSCDCGDVWLTYAADNSRVFVSEYGIPDEWDWPKAADRGNVTPLYMPRWASRLTLELTAVRAERLQNISEADAVTEGVEGTAFWRDDHPPSICYSVLWDSINGPGSWDTNPWVWALTFAAHCRNVNDLLRERAA